MPVDVTGLALGLGGVKVPLWSVTGDLADVVHLTAGRWPQPGEALTSAAAQSALGMDEPFGAVATSTGTQFPVVGRYTVRAPFEDLATGVLVAGDSATPAHTLDVVITSSAVADTTQRAVLGLLARPDPAQLTVTSPLTLAEVQQAVLGDLGGFGRGLLLLVLGAGAGLVAVVVLSDVLLRRKDLGRRRALGAPRWALVALVTARTTIAATGGAVVGVALAVALSVRGGQATDMTFTAGTAILAVLVAAIASLPPAVAAAYRDPVRVLRTPSRA